MKMNEQIGWGIDKKTNKPYVYVDGVKRFDLENLGYYTTMKVRMVIGKERFFKPVPNSTLMNVIETYVLKEYVVKVKGCLWCENRRAEGFDMLQKGTWKSGILRKCFLSRMTTIFMDYSDDRYWTLISERPIDEKQVIELVEKGQVDYINDTTLWHLLEEHFNRTF